MSYDTTSLATSIHGENLGLQVALHKFREYCPMIVQSHMGKEIQTLGKYLCTGPLQYIQFFSSTPEDEVTARGKLTTDLVMVTLASTTLASEHFPLTLSLNLL